MDLAEMTEARLTRREKRELHGYSTLESNGASTMRTREYVIELTGIMERVAEPEGQRKSARELAQWEHRTQMKTLLVQ